MARNGWQVAALVSTLALAGSGTAATLGVDRDYSKTFNDCMAAAAGSTMPMEDCIGAERDAWDKQLNQVYQGLIASRPTPGKDQLREGERAWLRHEKAKCDHAGDDEAGGSLQQVEIDQCYLDDTIRRTLYLRGLH